MKRKLIVFGCLLLLTISLVLPGCANEASEVYADAEIHARVFGASVLSGLKSVGFVIINTGSNGNDVVIENISYMFTVKSIEDDGIDVLYTGEIESLEYNEGHQFSTNGINGNGLVELSITVTSSNAGEVTDTLKGYQIGPFTLSRPLLFAFGF